MDASGICRLMGLYIGLLALTSCMTEHVRTDEDPTSFTKEVPIEVLTTFSTLYPNAVNPVWEKSGNYYVCFFEKESYESAAWFDEEGIWYQYKGEISARSINQNILSALKKSEYAAWSMGEIEILERKEMGTSYIVEVKKDSRDYNLYFTEEGILVKVIDHNYDNPVPVIIPDEVSNFVQSYYSEPVIYELILDNLGVEVGIVEEELYKTIVMDGYYDWLCTLWEIDDENIPTAVQNGFSNSKYAGYEFMHVKLMMKIRNGSIQPFYTYYLRNESKTVLVTFTQTGSVDIAISV